MHQRSGGQRSLIRNGGRWTAIRMLSPLFPRHDVPPHHRARNPWLLVAAQESGCDSVPRSGEWQRSSRRREVYLGAVWRQQCSAKGGEDAQSASSERSPSSQIGSRSISSSPSLSCSACSASSISVSKRCCASISRRSFPGTHLCCSIAVNRRHSHPPSNLSLYAHFLGVANDILRRNGSPSCEDWVSSSASASTAMQVSISSNLLAARF